jgi:hypothetical protein
MEAMIFACGLSFKIMVFNATLQQYFSYIVAVSFIGGGNHRLVIVFFGIKRLIVLSL